jgi:hypothetical protein
MRKVMQLVVLNSLGNFGKTTILNLVYDTLVNHGATIRTTKTNLGRNPKDFEVILNYNGKTIVIYTMGDITDNLIETMEKYALIPVDF